MGDNEKIMFNNVTFNHFEKIISQQVLPSDTKTLLYILSKKTHNFISALFAGEKPVSAFFSLEEFSTMLTTLQGFQCSTRAF